MDAHDDVFLGITVLIIFAAVSFFTLGPKPFTLNCEARMVFGVECGVSMLGAYFYSTRVDKLSSFLHHRNNILSFPSLQLFSEAAMPHTSKELICYLTLWAVWPSPRQQT